MRSHRKPLFTVAALLMLLLLVPPSALAGKPLQGIFGEPGSGNGQFNGVRGIAVDQSTGDVLVVDQGNERVQRFESDGTYLSQFGSGQLSSPDQIAVAPDGFVLVADTGNDRIAKFTPAGAFESGIGTSGEGALSEPHGVAVSSDGSIYVADTGNARIVRFDSTGAYDSEFGSGELTTPVAIAVDSTGASYVLDLPEPESFFESSLRKFSAAGLFDSVVNENVFFTTVAGVDQVTDHVFFNRGLEGIVELDSLGSVVDTHIAGESLPTGLGLNYGNGPLYVGGDLFARPPERDRVLIFEEPGMPAALVTIDPVTAFDATSATFNGMVDPNGDIEANWRFEISSDGGASWREIPPGGNIAGGAPSEPVSVTATDLEPATLYQVRLVASKPFGLPSGIASTSFTTVAIPPAVQALDPGPVTDTTAWLGARVDPQNALTTYYVEYSTDPAFSQSKSLPVSKDATAGSGGDLVLAVRRATGLQPSTTYRYRLVAVNATGSTVGATRSFATNEKPSSLAPGLPDGRVWERVSPTDKLGSDILGGTQFAVPEASIRSQAADHGDAVTFSSSGKFGGDGAPAFSQYLAKRGPEGWSTVGINPRQLPNVSIRNPNRYEWFSDDLTMGIVSTNASLNPDAPERVVNLYLRDNATGMVQTISNGDESTPKGTNFLSRGASADGTHVVFYLSSSGTLFERVVGGEVREVGILPDGTPTVANLGGSVHSAETTGLNPVSDDGSRVFFTAEEFGDFGDKILYVRENGATTREIGRGAFQGARSSDGGVAFLIGGPDSSKPSLLRWDASAPAGSDLIELTAGISANGSVLGTTAMTDDAETVYFVAVGDLTGEGSHRHPNLYRWRQGEGVRFIATVGDNDTGLWTEDVIAEGGPSAGQPFRQARVTPNGRYLAFISRRSLTAYDTDGTSQIYIYDSAVDRLACASCGLVTPKSKTGSWLLSCQAIGGGCSGNDYFNRNLSQDGRRLIFDSGDALVPRDTNGTIDVYEWQDGELHLLSSGTSAAPSRFVDASVDGDDVFFTTAQQLAPSDRDDLVDIYDARVGGRVEPKVGVPCVADECQGTPTPPPAFRTPATASVGANGNASPRKPRCRKGRVLRKGKCAARKSNRKGHINRHPRTNRRAGR